MKRLGGLLAVCLVGGACSASYDEEKAGETRLERSPLAEPPEIFRVSDALEGGHPSAPEAACNAEGICLVIWSQDMGGSVSELVAKRLNRGVPMEEGVIRIGTTLDSAVAAGDGEFLVAWANLGIWGTRISASTGEMLDPSPIAIVPDGGSPDALLFRDGRYSMFHQFDTRILAVRIEGDEVLDAQGIDVAAAPENWWAPPGFALGPGSEIGIASKGSLYRFDPTTGVANSEGSPFGKYGARTNGELTESTHPLTFDGQNYVAFFHHRDQLRGARIRASDGALLDPPDDIAQVPGGRVVYPESGSYYNVQHNGDNTWLTFSASSGSAIGILIPPNLVRPDPTSYQPDFWFDDVEGDARIAVDDGEGLLVDRRRSFSSFDDFPVKSRPLTLVPGSAPSIGPATSLSLKPAYHGLPGAGSDGHDFLVVYSNGQGVEARRIDGETGARLGTTLALGGIGSFQRPPVVTWTGQAHFAIWESRYGMGFGACAGGGGLQLLPAIACRRGECARLSQSVGSFAISAADPGSALAFGPTSVVNDDGVSPRRVSLAATNHEVASDARYLAFWATGVAVRFRVYDGNLAPLTAGPTSLAAIATEYPYVAAASDGTRFLLAWLDGTQLKTTIVDAQGSAGAIRDWGAVDNDRYALTFDGASFVLTRNAAGQSWLTRIDAAGARVGEDAQVPSTTVVGSSFGRSLVTFDSERNDMAGVLIHGSFFDNPLGPGLSARGPSPCDPPDGGGGEGGEGGRTSGESGAGNVGVGSGGDSTGGVPASGGSGGDDQGVAGEAGAPTGRGGADSGNGGDGAGVAGAGDAGTAGHPGSAGDGADQGGAGGSSGATSGTSGGGGAAGSAGTTGRGGDGGAGNTSAGGSAGAAGRGGSAGTGGTSDAGGEASDGDDGPANDSGCGCRTPRTRGSSSGALLVLVGLAFTLRTRSKRRSRA